MKRRILSIITALALCLSLCPTWALAAEADPSLCKHHPEHTEDCGYTAPTEGHDCGHEHTEDCFTTDEAGGKVLDCQHSHDSECGYVQADPGTPCGYECRICPIEDLIAALPEQVTEDNAADVRAQLDHILDLYRELDEDEQDQIDLSRIYALQGALDNANAPMMVAGEINISQTGDNILTAEDGDCPGHTFTGTAQAARIYVESGTHDVTFSNLNITNGAQVGIAPGAAMNLTIDETNTIQASNNLAGIYVPVGATLIINGTGSLNVSGNNSAGIGGATYALDESGSDGDPNCGTVEINGGTVTATGGSTAAGIGGGIDTEGNPGNGGKVTINGGTVTATGGSDSYYGGAGIGGSAGETASDPAGNGGTLTINGGTVNLTAGTHEPQYPAYGFGQGSGSAPGGTCELTLADASYLAEGTTLDPNGKYTINGDPTADMIVVPELVYTGEVLDTSGIKIDDSKTGTGTYFGQTFTVNASADGWTYTIDPAVVKAAGDYTVTFSKEGHTSISKTFTVAQSGTQFVGDGEVKTYNGDTLTTSFSAGDTITVKATPTATGAAPQKAAARLQGGPGMGQMALYVGDALVSSEAADADADGTYTMEVSASDVLTLGGVEPNGDPITLTAKFVGNDNMADGAGTVEVNITAAAKAERDGTLLGYYDESGLDAALLDKNNEGAVFTLLDNMETELKIRISCTLDLNGKTVHSKGEDDPTLSIYNGTTVTIRGEGTVLSEQGRGFYVGGTATLEGGTFISSGEGYSGVYVRGKLIVTGENVVMRNTGNGNGLSVDSGNEATAQLSAGTYEGGAAAIEIYQGTGTLAGLLNQEGASRVAYYKDNTTLVTEGLDGKTLPSGSYTVKACTHTGEGVCTYAHNENTSTHTKTCLACGYTETGDCGFEKTADPTADSHTGQCPDCKRDRSGAHSFSDWAGNPVARTCTVCGYEQTAVARVEKDSTTTYVGALANAFTEGNSGATVTLLDDLTNTDYANRPKIDIRCTLNLNGHTLRSDLSSVPTLEVSVNGNVTIAGSGEIVSNSDAALYVVGTAVLEGGTFCSGGTYHGAVEVLRGNLSVTGENVVMENTGSGNGLLIYDLEAVRLSAGKYSGAAGAISVSTDAFTLSSLLNQEGTSRVAYYKDNTTLVTEGLDGQALPGGSYTVKECTHAYQYAHTPGTTVHSQTCPACGDAKTAETCSYDAATGRCACGSTLAVTLPADLALTYDGTAKTPDVTVTVDGTELAAEKYQINYDNNINAGNTAKVTVTAANGSFSGSVSTTFSISKASLTIKANDQAITYGGNIATGMNQVTSTGLASGDTLESVTLEASTSNVPGGTIKPTGAVIKHSGEDVTANYTIAYQEGTLTINKAQAAVTGNPTANTLTYTGAAQALVTAGTASVGEVVYSLTKTGTYSTTIPTGTNAGSYTVWYKVEGTTNYEGTALASVDVTIAQATAPAPQTGTLNVQNGQNRDYTYNLSRLLPVLASGQSFGGEVTYTLKSVNITEAGYYDIDTAAISGTTLTLPVKAVTSSDEGQIGTITVTISSKNFADVDATINVNRVNKQPVSIEGVTAQNGTYNGESHRGYTGTPTASPYSGGFKVSYAKADGTALSGAPTNAGDYTVTIDLTEAAKETYAADPLVLSFSITKASATVTADSKTITKGNPVPVYSCTVSPTGANLGFAPALSCDYATDSGAGEYPITVTGAETSADGNYTITYVNGTLTVKEPSSSGGGGGGDTPVNVTGVSLDRNSLTLTIGERFSLTVTITPSNADNKSVTWASGNSDVASVNGGTVTATGVGTTTITVTTQSGGYTASCTVTVKAKAYTITYDANGGAETMRTGSAADGEPFTLPGCTFTPPEGKVFDAWAIGSADGTQVKAGSSHTFTEDTTVYAVWKDAPLVTYAVTYNANGGTGTMTDGIAPDQEAFVLPECGFTAPEGKEFDCWAIGSVTGSKVQPGGSFTFTADTTVYAIWKDLPPVPYNITGIVWQNGEVVPGATVQLKQGADVIATQTTGPDGSFYFSDVPADVYNLVATKDGITVTVMQEITNGSANLTITLPNGKTNTVVEIKGQEGTPPVVVGEMENLFTDDTVYTAEDKEIVAAGGTVEFKMVVEKQTASSSAAIQIEASKPAGQTIGLYLDLSIIKTVTPKDGQAQTTSVTQVGSLIETLVPLPAEMQGKASYTVYREHDGIVEALPNSGNGERYTVSRDKKSITIYARKYSTYAVAWSDNGGDTPVDPGKPSRPSGGGGSSVSTYAVTVSKTTYGKVVSSRTNASSGGTVTLTVTPDSGYTLETLTVTDSRGNTITLTEKGGGKYTFTMPSRAVTVTASFAPIAWSNPYTDVASGAWYYEAVRFVSENKLMGGYGSGLFGPNDTLTRAQFAQILFNKEGRPVVNYLLRYNDVADGAWYTEAVRWAVSQGIASGYGNGIFGPNDPITREQLAVMLWRYAGSPVPTDKELHFNDANEISGFALEAMRWAVENGVMDGYGNRQLAPKGLATRAQAAQMLMNFLKNR